MDRTAMIVAPTMFSADYGGATRIIDQIKALSLLGIRAKMYTYSVRGDLDKTLSVQSHALPVVPRFHQGAMLDRLYLDFWLTLKILLSNDVKPIFVLSYNSEAVLISKIANLFRSPIVMDAQGLFSEEVASQRSGKFSKTVYVLERKVLEFPSLILASNPILADFIVHELGCPREKVDVVFDAADTNLFAPRSKDDPKVKSLGSILDIKKGTRVVLYAGSFSTLQGTDILLKAARLVLEQEKNVFFVLAGGGWSKDYESYIQIAKDLDILTHVRFIPGISYVKTLPYLLNLVDVAVAPKLFSLQSHGKLSVLMASGVPTVVFESTINRLFLGSLGIYAKEVNEDALAEAVIKGVYEVGNDDLRRKLRMRAVRYFSLERLANDMQHVCERVTV